MRCLKSLSNRQKNLLTFGIGFAIGVAVFWGLWEIMSHSYSSTDYEGSALFLVIPMLVFYPIFYIIEKLGININGIWFIAFGWGVIIGLLFLLTRWLFVKKN